jgi:phosphomannomutase
LRYSGTEPKARLLIEGRDRALLDHHSAKIADCIKRQIGVSVG